LPADLFLSYRITFWIILNIAKYLHLFHAVKCYTISLHDRSGLVSLVDITVVVALLVTVVVYNRSSNFQIASQAVEMLIANADYFFPGGQM